MRLSVNRPRMRPAGVSVSHVRGKRALYSRVRAVRRRGSRGSPPSHQRKSLGTATGNWVQRDPWRASRSRESVGPASAAAAAEHPGEDVEDRGFVGLDSARSASDRERWPAGSRPRRRGPACLPRMSVSTLAPLPPEAPAISGPSRSPYLPPATFFDRYASTIGARIGSSFWIRPLTAGLAADDCRRGSAPPGRCSGRRCC